MVKMVHFHNAHPKKSCKKTKPTFLCRPLTFKSQDSLLLLVMIINKGQVVIEQMGNPGAWNSFEATLPKSSSKYDVCIFSDGSVDLQVDKMYVMPH